MRGPCNDPGRFAWTPLRLGSGTVNVRRRIRRADSGCGSRKGGPSVSGDSRGNPGPREPGFSPARFAGSLSDFLE